MAKTDKVPPAIEKYYYVEDKGTKWHLLCPACDEAWSVPKDKAHAIGNILHLLNHARSHDEASTVGAKKRAALRALNQ